MGNLISMLYALSLGERFSKIPVEELQAAADENDPQSSPMVKSLMKTQKLMKFKIY
jgi:hypothetical protein